LNKRWLILPLIVLADSSFAQTDTSYLNYIYERIRDGQSKDTIHYAANLKPFEIKDWAHKLNKKHVIGLAWPDDYDTLSLTRKERKYIQKQLKASLDSSWPDKLFPDSKVVPADSIDKYVRKLNLVVIDSTKSIQSSRERIARLFWAFHFSKPIYLRNKSLLIFYLKRFASAGGEENVKVYRREGNSWKRWMLIDGTAF
jgi:hypothetical protein